MNQWPKSPPLTSKWRLITSAQVENAMLKVESDMPEVFTRIVDRRSKAGRTEKFVTIEVHVSDDPIELNWKLLDGRGKRDLQSHAKDGRYEAVAGVAKIRWKSDADRAACIADHDHSEKRRQRWDRMKQCLERMKSGEFPQFAHGYLHPSLTGQDGLMVIDGTRRMLAYLELGRDEMPVVVFRALSGS